MSNHQFTRPEGTGGKSILGSDDKTPLNQLEKNALGNLDDCLLYTSDAADE